MRELKIIGPTTHLKMILIMFGFMTILFGGTRASVLVADKTMSRMVELNAVAPFCTLYTDRGVIQKMVLGTDPKKVRQMSNKLVSDLEETCKDSFVHSSTNQRHGLIYPGTKWCGPGDIAASYNDLGQHAAEDACCREHDQCPMTIGPGHCIEGLCNKSPLTRSHCDCDAKFRRCLQTLNTEVANTLGALFFNVIQVICFKERRPCSEWQKNGYRVSESDRLCAQYNFRPSDKYVPLMPLNVN
ncbi:phospholipase A2 hemilipin isoform X1 [Leptopilina boulardi]|uniref:phospholipase A2 hemilipin isoform X1 n=2 Tax=Leptopilina boulardi TaxID=63433 RepID=UPI0021F5FAE6|nr:phospholipase A2 hemilipin isoform X1 [Leptopilina boulardi]